MQELPENCRIQTLFSLESRWRVGETASKLRHTALVSRPSQTQEVADGQMIMAPSLSRLLSPTVMIEDIDLVFLVPGTVP